MKKIITILLAGALASGTATYAKQPDKNAGPKSKAGPPPKQQHVSAAPKIHPDHNTVSKPQLRKSATIPSSKKSIQTQQLSRNAKTKNLATVPKNQLPAVQANKKNAFVPNPEAIQRIRAQHANFKAKPSSSIASVRFNQNYQIAGAQNWNGPQYQVFASYRPQWHDQGWWQSRYSSNLLLIGGGWYYWDAGYWYPAWGYDEAAAYYPYDGPIYVGDSPRPFDQVVADCQATLQEQGYYKGEVDGLMGPLTRQALADFQRDNGLITTAALDQPTLSSLGLG
ncbi:MAG: hypothetical protein QOD80_463 [Verrucomicrobiota bacterium]